MKCSINKNGELIVPSELSEINTINLPFDIRDKLIYANIPDNIIRIEDSAFAECYNLQNVTMSNSVTYLGEFAFYKCKSLEYAILSNSINGLYKDVFNLCSSLIEINIPKSINHIDESVFSYCNKLEHITIPDSVERISGLAVYKCDNLKSVTISSKLDVIGTKEVFLYCKNLKYIKYDNEDILVEYLYGRTRKVFHKKEINDGIFIYKCKKFFSDNVEYAVLCDDNISFGNSVKDVVSNHNSGQLSLMGNDMYEAWINITKIKDIRKLIFETDKVKFKNVII